MKLVEEGDRKAIFIEGHDVTGWERRVDGAAAGVTEAGLLEAAHRLDEHTRLSWP